MSEREEILAKLGQVWDLSPDKSLCGLLHQVFWDSDGPEEWVEDEWLIEALDEIIDLHENEEDPDER